MEYNQIKEMKIKNFIGKKAVYFNPGTYRWRKREIIGIHGGCIIVRSGNIAIQYVSFDSVKEIV
jgi:hypothetical protein